LIRGKASTPLPDSDAGLDRDYLQKAIKIVKNAEFGSNLKFQPDDFALKVIEIYYRLVYDLELDGIFKPGDGQKLAKQASLEAKRIFDYTIDNSQQPLTAEEKSALYEKIYDASYNAAVVGEELDVQQFIKQR